MARVGLPLNVAENLDFGAPAAERDIGRGLEKYFIESVAYQRVSSGAKTIILGNRGSGKSAIFQVLASRERSAGSHVIELSPEDYSYELLSATMAAEGSGSWAKHGAYAAAWKYLIYVLIMKELSKKGMRLKKGAATAIYKYVRDNHATAQMGKLAVMVSYLKRLETIKLGPLEAGMRARELDKLYKLEEIHHLLPALKEVLAKERVVVLVDELDRGWDSSEDAKAFVAGLFQGCVTINGLHDNLRVYISLRQELYDDIPALYEDAQKYRDPIRDNTVERGLIAQAHHQTNPTFRPGKGPQQPGYSELRRPCMVERRLRYPARISSGQLLQIHDRQNTVPSAGDHPVLHRNT
jgi:hypothetical protein